MKDVMTEELIEILKNNFPFIVRDDVTIKRIFEEKSNIILTRRDENKELIGVSVINENTIILLCVNKEYRNKGIGSELLKQSEDIILSNGYKVVVIGAGFDYLMPGVPKREKVYQENLESEDIFSNVDEKAYEFFKKRGYYHSWGETNCFDLRLNLNDFNQDVKINDNINGINYCWARLEDKDSIVECTNDAEESFTKYYLNEKFYDENSKQRILIAKEGDLVVGAIIVNLETEEDGLGSAGCTAVRHSHRSRHIASNMVRIATKYLKDKGMSRAYIGYTYSGLDKLYGYAGYKICVYYFMAKKELKK